VTIRDIGRAVLTAVVKSGGKDIAIEGADIVLDVVTDSELVDELPVVSWIVKAGRIGQSIRDQLFVRKLQRFLMALEQIPDNERMAFGEQLNDDSAVRQDLGEQLIIILDRLDELEKADMLARAFRAYIAEDIPYDLFLRIARVIDRCMIHDLKFAHNFERATDAFANESFDLAASGVIQIVQLPAIRTEDSRPMYMLSDFGHTFVNLILREG
jgi:hypothetical protein